MNILLIFFLNFNLHAADATSPIKKSKIIYDQDGDAIIILDNQLRSKINKTKMLEANHLYDNELEIKKFKEQYAKDILAGDKRKYAEYTTEEGDDLNKISQKIYGTTLYWSELQLLNENHLKSDIIKPGMKLKYIVRENKE